MASPTTRSTQFIVKLICLLLAWAGAGVIYIIKYAEDKLSWVEIIISGIPGLLLILVVVLPVLRKRAATFKIFSAIAVELISGITTYYLYVKKYTERIDAVKDDVTKGALITIAIAALLLFFYTFKKK